MKLKNYTPPSRGKGSKLTALQLAFVDHYMVCKVGSEAIVKAGSKTRNPIRAATEMMAHPLVAAEIQRRTEARLSKSELTIEFLTQKLLDIIGREEEDNPQAALRAIELAGKHLGMYKERQEISGPDGEAIQMEQRTRENADVFTSQLKKLTKKATEEDNIVEFKKSSHGSQ